MAYEGDELNFCPANMFDFRRASAVIVTGDGINIYGHMLLNTGGVGGNYFQVAGVVTRPRYMDEDGYQRYLRETNKKELNRIPVPIPRPEASQLELEKLLNENWLWLAVTHNCESMVEEIIMAGGGPQIHRGLFSLPTLSAFLWTCGARDCPSHKSRTDVCPKGVWFCNRVVPPCPSHADKDDVCKSGTYWTCGALSCPTHDGKHDVCPTGVWKCNRIVPPCPSHSSKRHHCAISGK